MTTEKIGNPVFRLASTISDRMVVQRDRPLFVRGWTEPNERIDIGFGNSNASGIANSQGAFAIPVTTPAAGGPYELHVTVGLSARLISDVMVGEVWLCSGQSNMAWTLEASEGVPEAINSADIPQVRFFILEEKSVREPAMDSKGVWQRCTPESARGFSAVAFFMARALYQQLQVPVGIVQSARGGSAIESWISRDALEANASLSDLAKQAADPDAQLSQPHDDPVLTPSTDWAGGELDESNWKKMRLPQAWQAAGLACNGAVWFRRDVDIPLNWAGRDLLVSIGEADDCDHSFFNGYSIGSRAITESRG
jgi:sialate O-acetylesterase